MTDTTTAFPVELIQTPIREDRLVVTPSFVEGTFDSHAVDCPFVFSAGGRQGMTYVGWDGRGYQTALTWNDGGTWTTGKVILARDSADPVRRNNAALTSIIRDNDLGSPGELRRIDGWYYGTFHAYPGAGYETGPGSVGIVRSRDLYSWERVGAMLRPQDGGVWERGGLYKSWLMEYDGLFYLFYNAKNFDDYGSVVVPPSWIEQTGLAISSDLRSWERYAGNPVLSAGGTGAFDERFASDPCVLRVNDYWVMFYFGLATDGHARESYATSTDLLHWTKSGEVLLDVGPAGSIDSLHTHKPAIITWNGSLEHYYTAVAPREPIAIGRDSQSEMRGIARATNRG